MSAAALVLNLTVLELLAETANATLKTHVLVVSLVTAVLASVVLAAALRRVSDKIVTLENVSFVRKKIFEEKLTLPSVRQVSQVSRRHFSAGCP